MITVPGLSKHFFLLEPHELEALQLLGPGKISERAKSVLGDCVALTPHYSSLADNKPGQHGGCRFEEVRSAQIKINHLYQPSTPPPTSVD